MIMHMHIHVHVHVQCVQASAQNDPSIAFPFVIIKVLEWW